MYLFAPTLTGTTAAVSYSVLNLPSWATFSAATGRLSGIPAATDVGMYPGIVIGASSGGATVSLPAFSIVVAAATTAPAGVPYPGYSYSLPTARPFISLSNYSGTGAAAATARLKAAVDDAVRVTNSVAGNATYAQLVTALNPDHYGYSPVDSVLMYKLTGDATYINQAIRMEDLFIQSESVLITAGAVPSVASDDYLNVGPILSEVALTYDYGYALLTPAQRTAWSAYAEQAVYNVWNYRAAKWGSTSHAWSGWATSDPGDNYFYSFMRATQLWALASQNPTWSNFLQQYVYTLLVPYFSTLTGGGSREGTGYGTALMNLFENYAYWKGSSGEDLSAYSGHARATIDYWVHATVPTFQYFAPIGDQSRSSMPALFDYQRRLMLEDVALNPGSAEAGRGIWWLARAQLTDGGNGWVTGRMTQNYDYRYDLLATAGAEQAPTSLLYDATGTGALFARSDWSTAASWMYTNAGPYDQSHAHQDQGSFGLFKGTWLTVTSNILSSSGTNQGTGVHNVVRFDVGTTPVPQNNSVSTRTVADSGDVLQISENLTPAYSSNASRVSSWVRNLSYQRSTHSLAIHDSCAVATSVTPVWQLHVPLLPVRQSDGSYLAGTLRIVTSIPASPTIGIVSMPTVSSDFLSGYRLELRGPAGSCEFAVTLTAQ